MKLEKHPDKTFIGQVARGFDFLGYHFSPEGLVIAEITWNKFVARWHRLYEQKKHALNLNTLLDDYVRRWQRWKTAGLGNITLNKGGYIKEIPPGGGIPC